MNGPCVMMGIHQDTLACIGSLQQNSTMKEVLLVSFCLLQFTG